MVKRILKEILEIKKHKSEGIDITIDGHKMTRLPFKIEGWVDSDYEGGVYIGVLDTDGYPSQPPNVLFLTPTGRFTIGEWICTSLSSHHNLKWESTMTLLDLLRGIKLFMTCDDDHVGAYHKSSEIKKQLAKLSHMYNNGTAKLTSKIANECMMITKKYHDQFKESES